MRKLLIGFIIISGLGMIACGNTTKKPQAEPVPTEQDQKRGFQLPEVPVMLREPELRAAYVAEHYWDHFDFRDTAYIHLPEITEQAAVNYMDMLRMVSPEKALESLSILSAKASVEPLMMSYFWETLSRYWHNPNSPLKNEDLFILLCKGVEQTPQVEQYLRDRARYQRVLAEKNRVGMKANDIVYTLANGKQEHLYDLKAPYTLVFFYNPDCHTCAGIKQTMNRSSWLKEQVAGGRMKVLTLYPDEDVNLWREHLPEMADGWVNGYDKGQRLTVEDLYDLSSIPSFYLLDGDKKVLLKDVDWEDVLHFFEK